MDDLDNVMHEFAVLGSVLLALGLLVLWLAAVLSAARSRRFGWFGALLLAGVAMLALDDVVIFVGAGALSLVYLAVLYRTRGSTRETARRRQRAAARRHEVKDRRIEALEQRVEQLEAEKGGETA